MEVLELKDQHHIILINWELLKLIKMKYLRKNILELAIEAGADECITKENIYEIQCSINEIYNVKKILKKKLVILFQQKLNGYH